ncbi:MAG: dihydropteroate synthase [Gammaproteobacteria bacterium]|nr:dihydropteroate synthase [Gammaproteobacteria bacterium]
MSEGVLACGDRALDLTQPAVMGILNATPDSFWDGGRHNTVSESLFAAEKMVADGAVIIDVGGESTRPGAPSISTEQELDRVIPVIQKISSSVDVIISVDTSSPAVMLAAADAGAGLINDVRALGRKGALKAAAKTGLPVCLMHMQGGPATMQDRPFYDDVFAEVNVFFDTVITRCVNAGISKHKLLIDPGFGFGKSLEHNLILMRRLGEFVERGMPVLVGVSRKSMIGAVLDRTVDQRLYGSLAAASYAVTKGVKVIRTHDVRATVDSVKMLAAILA